MAVDVLIFSKNRPAQLDLLLHSISKYAPALYSSVTVLVTWSAPFYAEGYKTTFIDYGNKVQPYLECDFQTDVIRWLCDAGEAVSFLVDDDVFYADAPQTVTYPMSLRGGDYDYPFSVDGNIYERDCIINLLGGLGFKDPTEMEHYAWLNRDRLPFTTVYPCYTPCVVGIPLNRVSDSSQMPHMGQHEYDMNERYLNGERLMIPEKPTGAEWGAHEAIELSWSKQKERV